MNLISLILCISLGILIILPIIWIVYQQHILRRMLKSIPQCGNYPFGKLWELLPKSDYERAQWFIQRMLDYKEGIFIIWAVKPFILLCKPKFLEIIFSSTVNIEKGFPYSMLESWLGKGLLTSTGKQWYHDRKFLGLSFHFNILKQFAPIISEKAEILTKCLEKEITKNSGKAINIIPFAHNVTLDIICETAMDVNVHAQEVQTTYVKTIHRASKLIFDRCSHPWYWPNWVYNLVTSGKEYKSVVNIIHEFTKEVIHKKKITRQSRNDYTNSENGADEYKQKKKAFLDLLLDQNEIDEAPLSDDELRAQVDTFMFEGYDTSAGAIIFTLFLLGNNLEHQEKLHEELDEVFKDSETPASVKELSQLRYLDRIIKESLRMAPSVPVISRKLTEDVKFENYMLPKGVTVILPIALMHLNPEVWPDPMKFDPDRFLPENSKHRNPYAYVPFSAGPRNCIGQKLALLIEKTILTAILRKWRVKSVKTIDELKYGVSLILRPTEDVLIYFIPKK